MISFFPVVAKSQARIRIQLLTAHTQAHLYKTLLVFEKVGLELGQIKNNTQKSINKKAPLNSLRGAFRCPTRART